MSTVVSYLPGAGPEGTVGNALRRALAGYRLRMDQALADAGFADRRFPQGRVLRMCSGDAGTTISDVGRALGITRQGASKIVAGLRQRGYVNVTTSQADGREKILTPTPRAEAFLAAQREASQAIEARLREEIGAEGVGHLLRFLDLIAGEEARPGAGPREGSPAIRALRFWDSEEHR
jgi:DNA-binding MarR family transcriptional regulator